MKKVLLSLIILLTVCSAAYAGFEYQSKFPYKYEIKNVKVCSDISPEFSKSHAEHALLVWNYFSKVFSNTPGSRIELYYTNDPALYEKMLKMYPTIVIKGARQLTAGWCEDHRKWFIMPYVTPDFKTQIHEVGHDFLYFSAPFTQEFPWFKEGTGMYFESGDFDKTGNLVVTSPFPSYYKFFLEHNKNGNLIPLKDLLYKPAQVFYTEDFTKTYSESMMLIFYLEKQYPDVMKKIIYKITIGEISSNDDLVSFITSATGKTLEQLDKDYVNYSVNHFSK